MNRLEFEKVIEITGIKNIVGRYHGRDDIDGPIYEWNGFKFKFSGSYYAMIYGHVPYDLVKILYEKYSNNEYLVRWDGGSEYVVPTSGTGCYHIDRKDGLLCFITELQDYYAKLNNNGIIEESQVEKQAELIGEVNDKLIKECKLGLTTNMWLKKHNPNELTEKELLDEKDILIRKLLKEYDKVVNPFNSKSLKLVEPSEYSNNIRLGFYSNKKDFYSMYACLRESQDNAVGYHRNNQELMYKSFYLEDKEKQVYFYHYYENRNLNTKNFNEEIKIDHFYKELDDKRKVGIEYSLSTGLIGGHYEEKLPITEEQKQFIIEELEKAIEMAKKITIDNMVVKKNVKKRTLKK